MYLTGIIDAQFILRRNMAKLSSESDSGVVPFSSLASSFL